MRPFQADSYYPIDLANLPASWEVTYVGDVISNIHPGFASGKHNKEGIGVPHLRPMNIDRRGYIDLSVVKYVSVSDGPRLLRGDVLFNNTNSPELIGKTAYIDLDVELAFSNHMTRLRPPDGLFPKFVAHQLHYLWMTGYFLHRCVKHVNQASVSSSALRETVPLVIAPLPEQSRIVAEIEKHFTRLDAAVASLKRARANLKRYRASVLKAACEGRLVPTEAELARRGERAYESASVLLERILKERRTHWGGQKGRKGKYKEPQPPDTSNLPRLPEGWVWATVEQLTPADRPCAYGVLQPGTDVPGGVPLVRVGDINDGRLHGANVKLISPSIAARYPRTRLRGGEVLISLVGAIGRTAVVPETLAGANTARAVGAIPLSRQVLSRWVNIWFCHPEKIWEMTSKAHEVARKTLNLEDVRGTTVALPPLAEQDRIVVEAERHLSVIQAAENVVEANLKRAERLRQAILKRAFEGKLVPQDSSDEPASVLLDRIRAEQMQAEAGGPARRRKGGRRSRTQEVSV